MLKVLQSATAMSSTTGGYINSTHPSPQQRIANVEALKFRKNETLRYRIQRFRNLKF